MKVEVIEKEEMKEELEFPFIGINKNDGKVVYFYADEKGVVLNPANDSHFKEGEHFIHFIMGAYEKLNGKVILEND
jgi:hypothetical protein